MVMLMAICEGRCCSNADTSGMPAFCPKHGTVDDPVTASHVMRILMKLRERKQKQ